MVRRVDYPVTYRFTRELLNKITNRAREMNVTRNHLVREILEKALKDVPSEIKDV